MLCALVERAPEGRGWLHEVKLDGYRLQAVVAGGAARLLTRSGLDWTGRFPALAASLERLPDAVLDVELVATDAEGQPDFAALKAAIEGGDTGALRFYAFDLLARGGEDLRDWPLLRKAPAGVVYLEHFVQPGAAVLGSACRMALEGIVSKRADSPYRSGGRDGAWVKAKCRGNDEFVVGGHGTGPKGRMTLLLGAWRDGGLVHLDRVGSGISDANERALAKALAPLRRATPPFTGLPAADRRTAVWVEPRLVAEVDYAGWTADGLLRQATYKGLREDKCAGEVGVPRPGVSRIGEPMPEPKNGAPKRVPARSAAELRGVRLSHPHKLLWPDDGISKRDLAAYYEAVGARLLTEIGGRPVSLLRTPDGIDGQRFFQRHPMPGTSSLVRPVALAGGGAPLPPGGQRGRAGRPGAGRGDRDPPLGGAEPEHRAPDRLVFDLDPADDVLFAEVVRAARAVRKHLDDLGLVPFAKTTGGKGLHVVVPLAPKVDWDAAKGFALALCEAMAAAEPQRFTTNMAKRARTGRIFLDYLRNERGATAVAAWSPRARPGAPVAMPLAWREVTERLDPAAFTLRTAPARLRRADPWARMADAAKPLPRIGRPAAARPRTGRAGSGENRK